jgi:transcriptional repressor NrdR
MYCPFCGVKTTRVIDSRLASGGDQVRRRRSCGSCGERFTTYEATEFTMPIVKKSDNIKVPFSD